MYFSGLGEISVERLEPDLLKILKLSQKWSKIVCEIPWPKFK